MHKVIKYFEDLQDNEYPYNVGDIYPRSGVDASENRIEELSTNSNRQGQPLIEFVEDDKTEEVVEEVPKAPKKRSKKAAEK